jgi:hypothetical protein
MFQGFFRVSGFLHVFKVLDLLLIRAHPRESAVKARIAKVGKARR